MSRTKGTTAPLSSSKGPDQRSPFWWLRWVPTAILVIIILDLVFVVGRVAIVPVLASFALAYLLNPLVKRAEERGLARPFGATLALLALTLAAIVFFMFVIPDLWNEANTAGQKITRYLTPENATRTRASIQRYSPLLDRAVGPNVEEFMREPTTGLNNIVRWLTGGQLSDFVTTAAASLDLLLVPFFVFYILVDFGSWRGSIEDWIPPRFRDPFSRLFDEVGRILESYVRGQLVIAMIMAVLYAIGFYLCRVPAWAGIAALSGFLNAVPYVGTILGLVLATGFTLADEGGFWRVAGVVGVFIVVQTIEGYFLTPKILGTRLSLHPMAVFLGLLIGGKLFGLLGIILAVPTIAVAKVFLKFLRELYKGSYFYHAGDIHPAQAPSEVLEERLAEAADTVLAEQVSSETGDELLAPDKHEDDPIASEKVGKT